MVSDETEDVLSNADRRRLNPEFVRDAISRLCELWERSDDGTIEYRAEVDAQRAVAITTQAHHAVRMARSILLVDDAARGIEIVPSVRLVLECGVTAAWLLLTPGSGHTLIRDGAEQRRKALEHLARLGEETGPGYEQALAALANLEDAEGPRSFIFEQRCNALKGGSSIYVLYRVLSSESHAGMGIADYYSKADDDSRIGLSFDRDAENSARVSLLGVTASMLLLAINADEIARLRPHRTTQIRRAAKRLGITTRIVGADGTELPAR